MTGIHQSRVCWRKVTRPFSRWRWSPSRKGPSCEGTRGKIPTEWFRMERQQRADKALMMRRSSSQQTDGKTQDKGGSATQAFPFHRLAWTMWAGGAAPFTVFSITLSATQTYNLSKYCIASQESNSFSFLFKSFSLLPGESISLVLVCFWHPSNTC